MVRVVIIYLTLISLVRSLPVEVDPPKVEAAVETDEEAERNIPPFAEWTYTDGPHRRIIYTAITVPTLGLHDAKVWCEALGSGSRLATPVTKGQLEFLKSKLKPFVAGLPTKANRAAFWVAGTDLYIHSVRGIGQYWIYSGEDIDVTFWNEHEPNDYEVGPNRYPETCIDLKVPARAPWAPFGVNDEVCNTQISFLCQKPGP